jgi:hypothetical protein
VRERSTRKAEVRRNVKATGLILLVKLVVLGFKILTVDQTFGDKKGAPGMITVTRYQGVI